MTTSFNNNHQPLESRLPFHLPPDESNFKTSNRSPGGNPAVPSATSSSRPANVVSSRTAPPLPEQSQSAHHELPASHGSHNIEYRPPLPVDSRQSSNLVHRRSQSIGGMKEVAANLNRWSTSTTSSKGNTSRRRSNSISTSSKAITDQSPPRKLHKARPATASPSRQAGTGQSFESSSRSPPVLPPLLTVPKLSVDPDSSPLTASPSTAGILSAAVHSTVPSYYDRFWNDTAPRDFSQQRRPPSRQASDSTESPGGFQGAGRKVGSTRRHTKEEEKSTQKGHSRHNSHSAKGSSETASSKRSSKPPSQKAMLSKALQKANTAVLLDNAQNFEGAMEAYSEACALLQQVMLRSSGDEDRRKLEAIRNTYTSRISELTKIAPHLQDNGKALPARPSSGEFKLDEANSPEEQDPTASYEVATATKIFNTLPNPRPLQNYSIPAAQVPRRRESLPSPAGGPLQPQSGNVANQPSERVPYSSVRETIGKLAPAMDRQYMPPPLSPIRSVSPNHNAQSGTHDRNRSLELPTGGSNGLHERAPSNESMSWLDTIDESGGSTASSVHSRTSSLVVRRKHIRAASGATEAEFDAALDAAVEAAYDEGFEPAESSEARSYDYDDDDEIVANVRRKVELARERVRQTEREVVIQDIRERERRRLIEQREASSRMNLDTDFDGNESEDEERMLEEMTRGYVMDGFEFGLQSQKGLPRESDSSGFSGRTWNSSIGSNPTTAGTVLSTVTEASGLSQSKQSRATSTHPPPAQGLPPPPVPASISGVQGVRSRRLSGQNAKQLKIDTASTPTITPSPLLPSPLLNDMRIGQPKTAGLPSRQAVSGSMNRPPIPHTARLPSSSFLETSESPDPLIRTQTNDSESNGQLPRSGSPGHAYSRSGIRKNFSSSSLKNLKNRNPSVSVSNYEDGSELSPTTPGSTHSIAKDGRLHAMPALPTPIAIAFKERLNGQQNGGLYLIDNEIHSPKSPKSPSTSSSSEAPLPLEPCPTEFMLRPFWLMRALYQTIAHKKGGYLSTKLFVPHDVWKVRGVKIKSVEDKIANCDFLTAALMKLAQVDTCDADALLEEMQALESVLEQIQVTLSKKLGNEVGMQSSGGMFKDAPAGGDMEVSGIGSKSGSMSSKSSSFSWRRLRSKNSGVGLANMNKTTTSAEGAKEGLQMGSLPMTSQPKSRFSRRDVSAVHFEGAHANYMASLARLFDAAQTIDQIARQVEDPGLRHADKTQVGLELCTRHAAEFFAFYICRFVLTDIGMLLDKFIKRGSEWVLA